MINKSLKKGSSHLSAEVESPTELKKRMRGYLKDYKIELQQTKKQLKELKTEFKDLERKKREVMKGIKWKEIHIKSLDMQIKGMAYHT